MIYKGPALHFNILLKFPKYCCQAGPNSTTVDIALPFPFYYYECVRGENLLRINILRESATNTENCTKVHFASAPKTFWSSSSKCIFLPLRWQFLTRGRNKSTLNTGNFFGKSLQLSGKKLGQFTFTLCTSCLGLLSCLIWGILREATCC